MSITDLTNRQVFLLAGCLELGLATFLIWQERARVSLALIAWFSTLLVIYRLGLGYVDYRLPCSCLGGGLNWLPHGDFLSRWVPPVLLGFVVMASYGFLLGPSFRKR